MTQALAKAKVVDAEAVQGASLLWAFGHLIGNTDMHAGNLSFLSAAGAQPYQLAPAYDMLPMAYAPARTGDRRQADSLAAVALTPQIGKTIWLEAYQLAQTFWQQLNQESRLSDEFRAIATASQQALAQHTLPSLHRMAE